MYNLNDQHFLKIIHLLFRGQEVFYILRESQNNTEVLDSISGCKAHAMLSSFMNYALGEVAHTLLRFLDSDVGEIFNPF